MRGKELTVEERDETFETFAALVVGLVAQPAGRTVCGMLTGGWSGPSLAPLPGTPVRLRGAVVPAAGGVGGSRVGGGSSAAGWGAGHGRGR